ncbi:MAG: YwiC-like family protein [Anaerolineaceae bacterium]|nr:MAG: YwiC-like family protein [Anaerolineaceae bacterium]
MASGSDSITTKKAGPDKSGSRLKRVALPASYGSWSLVSEPILLGIMVAPSWGGLLLALAGFLTFLLNQPLKIILADRQRGRQYARTRLAFRVAAIYILLAAICFAMVIWLLGLEPFLPLIVAVPLLIVFTVYDNRPGRSWQAELSAPTGFSAISASIALAAGWDLPLAFALWAVMIGRSVPAVLYVRARLRLAKGKPAASGPAIGAHILALLAALLLVWLSLVPWTAVLVFLILLVRAIVGLSRYRREFAPMTLGWIETGIGLMSVLFLAAGYWTL